MALFGNNPLLDVEFLKKLDISREKEVYAKIVALTFDETPVEEITGRVLEGGSINVDGTSAVRRSCSFSMVAKELDINDFYWGLNTKFRLYIGLKNNIDKKYDDIIWFNQGIYLFTSFSTSHSTNNYTISVQGKDKMVLLNGEIGGAITALSHDFGTYDEIDAYGNITNKKMLLKDIIRELVHELARESFDNIIINDLEEMGIELLEYRSSTPMYLFIEGNGDDSFDVRQMTMNNKQDIYYKNTSGNLIASTLDSLVEEDFNKLFNLDLIEGSNKPKTIYLSAASGATPYTVAKIDYGETAGYRLTDLTYAGDLIASVGEAGTAILDKIKNMLGEFEYFYDIDGRFIFQKKKNYVQTSFNNIVREDYVESAVLSSSYSYSFEDGILISSFSNTPNLMNLKNDFSIWGTKTSVTGKELPVHLRYAIDKKPVFYKNTEGRMFIADMKIFEDLKEQKKNEIITEFYFKLNNFKLTYPILPVLDTPVKQPDGSFTPGWWDIRDWYEYYKLLTDTEPNYTMKWYSKNNLEGCVQLQLIDPSYKNNPNRYGWLLVVRANGTFNWQHGSGNPSSSGSTSKRHVSYYNENGVLITTQDKDENGQPYEKYFIPPYAACSDKHTYLAFLEDDIKKQGNTVYFYNPDFPQGTYEEVIKEKIEKEYEDYLSSGTISLVDWREIIYQMAIDYRKNFHNDDFYVDLANRNVDFYPTGRTGYEQYYTDMEAFWRELYDTNPEPAYRVISYSSINKDTKLYTYKYRTVAEINKDRIAEGKDAITKNDVNLIDFYQLKTFDEEKSPTYYNLKTCYRLTPGTTYYIKTGENTYEGTKEELTLKYLDLDNIYVYEAYSSNAKEYVKITDYILKQYKNNFNENTYYMLDLDHLIKIDKKDDEYITRNKVDNFGNLITTIVDNKEVEATYQEKITYMEEYETFYPKDDTQANSCWNIDLYNYPEKINFWIDFLDTDGDLGKYSVPAIGSRPKALNDSNVKAIYFRETPTVIFFNATEDNSLDRKSGYTYIQLQPGMENLFSISSQGKSAMDVLDTNLYNHSYCIESVSINSLPIYYLQPNTRIFIKDNNSNINGEYVLIRFTIPLNYNGTMSLTATKAAEEIY